MKGARSASGSFGRQAWTRPGVTSPMARGCPDCGALPHSRCFALTSWVVPRIPLAGFFTRRISAPHPGRRRAVAGPAPVTSGRNELRTRLLALAMRKLGGSERIQLRQWAGGSRRTEEELRQRIAQLEAQVDLPW